MCRICHRHSPLPRYPVRGTTYFDVFRVRLASRRLAGVTGRLRFLMRRVRRTPRLRPGVQRVWAECTEPFLRVSSLVAVLCDEVSSCAWCAWCSRVVL